MLGVAGRVRDRRIAEAMCVSGAVFWTPPTTWQWESTSTSNQFGWMVRSTRWYETDDRIMLVVRSLHQHDFHREGDLAVSGTVSGVR